ncbi:MFS general substrate transporter [Mycena kentingensis (nom. inval.)]|nr:MFS general substrate transporter [Mycena kentingensis (nom. inval.)]
MASEETPLLVSNAELEHERIYDRFSPQRKRVIVALVSGSAMLPMIAAGCFIPSVQAIARDLDTTGEVVSLGVSISIFGAALGAMFFATYSTFYGRRPMYLVGLPFLCAGSIGLSRANTVTQLMIFRFIQAWGSSGGFAVGGGVIGDIYKLSERGFSMGIFFSTSLLGNALAPVVGGWGARYASWRHVQLGIFVFGLLVLMGVVTLLPETSHPGSRGIDKLLKAEEDSEDDRVRNEISAPQSKWRWVWLNPFSCIYLCRAPNILFVTMAASITLYTDYVLLVPIAYTIGAKYDITNEAILGACFFPVGLGNILGAPLAGWLADRVVIKYRAQRGGVWVPEDRLRATLVGGAILVPLSVILCGLFTTYIPGSLGLTLNLISFFCNGVGVDLVLSPCAAYLVDVVHSRSAEVIAGTVGLRSFFLSSAVSVIIPSIHKFGLIATNTVVGVLAWAGVGLIWVTIQHGARLRAVVDVGFSTIETT